MDVVRAFATKRFCVYYEGLDQKLWKCALVRIRWKFSDEALWIRGLPTNR
jgi:hypothetical protein